MSDQLVTASISAEDTFSGPVPLRGHFNFSLSGTWSGTVTVQRSFDGGENWLNVADFEENGEYVGEEVEADVLYRFGVRSGNYTSGDIIGRLSQ